VVHTKSGAVRLFDERLSPALSALAHEHDYSAHMGSGSLLMLPSQRPLTSGPDGLSGHPDAELMNDDADIPSWKKVE
jgi:hypothetical protein